MTHGTRSAYNGGCRCPSCTEANTEASRARRRRLVSHVPSRPPSPCRQSGPETAQLATSEVSQASSRSVRGGGSGDLFGILSGLAETFLANHPATVAARTAAGGHGPAVTPVAPARSMPGRPTAFQSIPPSPPQVSRFILPGCPAFRLVVGCGCPFGWDTPNMPDVVVCPKHGNTRVASGSSSETWSGGPLPLAVLVEPELREMRPSSQV
jgi:hypothetical protein